MINPDTVTAHEDTPGGVWVGAGSRVRLRPVEPTDLSFLYRLATEGETGERWRHRGAVPDPQSFAQRLWDGVLTQSIVERLADSRPVGLACAYSANLRDGYVYLAGVCDTQMLRSGLCTQGLMLLADHLFRNWSFRKIYFEATAFNYAQFASGSGRIFVEEARLADHTFYDGRYWDLVLGSLTREAWNQLKLPTRQRPRPDNDGPLMGLDEFCTSLAEALGPTPRPVTPDARLIEDLDVDSLGALIIQDLVERQAGIIEFDLDLCTEPRTVRDAYTLYLTASSAPPRTAAEER
jgi:RimJ/RimL family protein N-acetyltransferase/acyl carrier protein